MGACTNFELPNILKAAQSIGEEQAIVAACVLICSRPPNEASSLLTCSLDALGSCKNLLAGKALLHIVQSSNNGHIQIEAIRRLGSVKDNAAKELLYKIAKGEFKARQGFPGQACQPDTAMSRQAAFEALSKLENPCLSDSKAVLDAITQDVSKGEDSGAFRAGIEAFFHVAKPTQLNNILEVATNCHNSQMVLRLLATCSKFDTKVLASKKEAIADCLIKNMQNVREDGDLLNKLCLLAKAITHKAFIQKLADSFSGDCLDRSRGKITSSALEAYPTKDEALTGVYLKYAQNPDNVQSEGKCITGLAACAAAGHAATIAKQLVIQENNGHKELVRSGYLKTVFANVPGVVITLCEAIDSIDDDGRRSAAAQRVSEGLVRVSLITCNTPHFDRLENIRGANRLRGGQYTLAELTAELSSLNPKDDAIAELAKRLCSQKSSPGAAFIATVFLKPFDDLANLFLDRLLTATEKIRLKDPITGNDKSPLASIEPYIFPNCREWFGRELSGRILKKDGRLNRYAIDLAQRNELTFVEQAANSLQHIEDSADAIFILQLLANKADAKSVRLLGRTIEQVRAGEGSVEIRRTALDLLGKIASQRPAVLDSTLTKELLSIIHNRIQTDTTAMRLSAYNACGQFANPSSIIPLRERQNTEKDTTAKEAIVQALASIKTHLLITKPSHQSPHEMIVAWLDHVADLGDHALATEVIPFLTPPRVEKVFLAALKCLSKIGTHDTIVAIDHFIDDTSPAGEVLKSARLAKATLQDRKDLLFIESLGTIFAPESNMLNLAINYEELFGIGRLTGMNLCLNSAMKQWEVQHWSDFVERIDGFCDLLSQDLYENHWGRLGLTKEQSQKYLSKQYAGRLYQDEFKNSLPTIQPLFVAIHSIRGQSDGAHPLTPDGNIRPGVNESQGLLVKIQFIELFTGYVQWLIKGITKKGH